ncbi:MAG: BON domain-containing protein [Candidatus Marinimicrobia bacterium]|nr:BON domain-containing protein [Candidatus Neomarinimicrobiota bacterium]MCF7827661.1 BON domain-containing protein [Candidatus Neomarinimicrobiota bacterium]MCF7881284.1 BON domain-containing protein [Candidatus Neomarinimicrobiota bacterium]
MKRGNLKIMKHILYSVGIFLVLAVFGLVQSCGNNTAQSDTMNKQPADAKITEAVKNTMRNARGIVSPENIRVKTDSGIVTFSGQIDNLLAKDRASRLAEQVKGVRAVINNLIVNSDRPDAKIRSDVAMALDSDPATEDLSLETKVNNGKVTLAGHVDSWQEHELAETVVKGIRGVTEIENNINVNFDLQRPDSEIKPEVESALRWDTRIDAGSIGVSVENNLVRLTGTVGSAHEKRLAKQKAYVAGASFVDASSLEVKSWQRAEMIQDKGKSLKDSEITSAIVEALKMDPRVNARSISVSVVDGKVTLTGSVDNMKAKRSAAQDAKNTRGVSYLTNNINVGPVKSIADSKLEQQIQQAISRDPFTTTKAIRVVVNDGHVTLNGTAESYFAKWQIGNIVSKINGVVTMDNNISVPYEQQSSQQAFADWDPVGTDFDYTPKDYQAIQLKDAIRYQFEWSSYLTESDIHVSVNDGVVTLSGTVNTPYEKNQATQETYEAGADSVVNKIEVEYLPQL